MIVYKHWKHAGWGMLLMLAACAGDAGDENEAQSEHAQHDADDDSLPASPGTSQHQRTSQGDVTINGVSVERGPAKQGNVPKDGPCKLMFGKSTPQDARDIFGEPSWTHTSDSAELLSFYYESEALVVLEFVQGRLNNFVLNGGKDVEVQCLPLDHG